MDPMGRDSTMPGRAAVVAEPFDDGHGQGSFLERIQPAWQGVGLAVLGGAFSEGIDLPGTRLIDAFVATPGLPRVSPLQSRIRQRLDKLFGADHGYADLVLPLQIVVQGASRLLRTTEGQRCASAADLHELGAAARKVAGAVGTDQLGQPQPQARWLLNACI